MATALEVAGFRARLVYIGIDVGRQRAGAARADPVQGAADRAASIGSPGVWPQTLRFLARSGVDLTPLVTQRFAIDEALDALDAAHHPESTIKAHVELAGSLTG